MVLQMAGGKHQMSEHWNPQLVAQLEAERAKLPPPRPTNTPQQVAERRKIAAKTFHFRNKNVPLSQQKTQEK
jgi:hypothetical protein